VRWLSSTGGRERIQSTEGEAVGFATVIIWFSTVLIGLYMLAVWLIEKDVTEQGVMPSRLPVAIIFGHLLLAATGLGVWVAYLVLDQMALAWTAIAILGAIAGLGATMFLRWIPVYRGPVRSASPAQLPGGALAASASPAQLPGGALAVPAEGNFPVTVVITHGLLAVSTLVLALLTALGVGGQ
jgi:hypothetical protein